MKWIETIELRSTSPEDPLGDMELQALATHLPETGKPYRMVILRHATVRGDISVHLLFDTDRVLPEGSDTGLRLKEMLRNLGLVSHKIWIETDSFQIPEGSVISDTFAGQPNQSEGNSK
jgi:hypothetical protein